MGLLKRTILTAAVLASVFLCTQGNEETETLQRLLHRYDRSEPPEGPTQVRLGIYINSFYGISEQTMDYSISMYFRQAWRDKRLEFPPIGGDRKRQIQLSQNHAREIWVPDTFFRNEKRASFHAVTVPNRLSRINSTGHIWDVSKISATMSCPMKLQKFPFDTQMCPMMFESFSNTMKVLYYSWLTSPVDVDKGIQLPKFTLQDVILYDCSQNYTAGAFPCLEARFVLRRDSGYYIRQFYIPSIIMVIVSWISFWISPEAVAARVGVGITALVTTGVLSSWGRSNIPTLSYTTALEIWMGICVLFILACLIESAATHFLARRQSGSEVDKGKEESWKDALSCRTRTASAIDLFSRIVFPLAFIVFIIIYFIVYTA